MVGVVVATHGELAAALVDTAQMVVGKKGHVVAVCINQHDSPNAFEQRFKNAVQSAKAGTQGVLVLTDMFGGTPSNMGMMCHAIGVVEVLTGVNLPMLIKALQLSVCDIALTQVARLARLSGTRAITMASEVLAGASMPEEKTT